MKVNIWHRRVAIISAGFLMLSAVTGILWAYAPHLYLKEGYLTKKAHRPEKPLSSAKVTVREALAAAAVSFGTAAGIQSATLRADAGRLFFEVRRREGKETHAALIDAQTGAVVSPIGEELAVPLAAQYVSGFPHVKRAEKLANYRHRSGKVFRSVYHISFLAPGDPAILIDRYSGEIVEELDMARSFHSWIMRLHQLQFFGLKKELTAVPALALIFLAFSGVLIWFRRYRRLHAD